ncbi:hypothetical protein COOONC_25966, partial [Cooperia oncophora]
IINSSHRWILPVLQWVVPTVYSIPLLLFSNATFVSSQDMEVLAERQSITIATSMTALFVSITFILCSLCYGTILRFLIKNRKSSSVAMKRERRLCVQFLGLFVGFALFVVFYSLQFTFSLQSNVSDMTTTACVMTLNQFTPSP